MMQHNYNDICLKTNNVVWKNGWTTI